MREWRVCGLQFLHAHYAECREVFGVSLKRNLERHLRGSILCQHGQNQIEIFSKWIIQLWERLYVLSLEWPKHTEVGKRKSTLMKQIWNTIQTAKKAIHDLQPSFIHTVLWGLSWFQTAAKKKKIEHGQHQHPGLIEFEAWITLFWFKIKNIGCKRQRGDEV